MFTWLIRSPGRSTTSLGSQAWLSTRRINQTLLMSRTSFVVSTSFEKQQQVVTSLIQRYMPEKSKEMRTAKKRLQMCHRSQMKKCRDSMYTRTTNTVIEKRLNEFKKRWERNKKRKSCATSSNESFRSVAIWCSETLKFSWSTDTARSFLLSWQSLLLSSATTWSIFLRRTTLDKLSN